jgi:hypothetical protein
MELILQRGYNGSSHDITIGSTTGNLYYIKWH